MGQGLDGLLGLPQELQATPRRAVYRLFLLLGGLEILGFPGQLPALCPQLLHPDFQLGFPGNLLPQGGQLILLVHGFPPCFMSMVLQDISSQKGRGTSKWLRWYRISPSRCILDSSLQRALRSTPR